MLCGTSVTVTVPIVRLRQPLVPRKLSLDSPSCAVSGTCYGAALAIQLPSPSRLPILYVILSVLVLVSVVPMYFYSTQVESINRDRLITNERLLQNTVTRSLADDISQHQESLRMMLANLSS